MRFFILLLQQSKSLQWSQSQCYFGRISTQLSKCGQGYYLKLLKVWFVMQPCSLCNSIEVTEIPESKDVRHWKCATCGEIIVSGSLLPSLPKRFEILWLLSAYSRKRSKSGLPPADLHTGNIDAIIEQMHKLKPNSIVESQNRVINLINS